MESNQRHNMMPLWLIFYLNLALHCDVPILEAFWLASDRIAFEASRLFPRIKYQLSMWNIRKNLHSFRYSTPPLHGHRFRSLELVAPLTFIVVLDCLPTHHKFLILPGYPQNRFLQHDLTHGETIPITTIHPSRAAWLTALLELFKTYLPISEFLLDFSLTTTIRYRLALGDCLAVWLDL
jgi:hypothetical protein